jgi:hypothetical protein
VCHCEIGEPFLNLESAKPRTTGAPAKQRQELPQTGEWPMMSNANFHRSKWSMISLTLVALGASAIPADAQYAPAVHVGGAEISGLPDDWTHHHVFFANPGTEQEAIQSGHYAQWQKIVNEPRYVIQQLKKNLPVQGPAAVDAEYRARWISEAPGPYDGGPMPHRRGPINPQSSIQRDWSMTSGGTGGLAAGHYPAKYQFNAASTSTESCTDYVVFPTGITGRATQATLIAYNNIYGSGTCTGKVPSILLSINTGGLADTSPVLSMDGTQVAFMQTTPTVTLTGSVTNRSTAFTVSAGTLTASDVGAAISGTRIPAGTTIATVTSPTAGTLSADATGTRTDETLTIAGGAQLVLLRIGTAGGGTAVDSPVSPAVVTNATYRTCTGPCYTTLALNGNPTDSNSAPFYVYTDATNGSPDILYVGDDSGNVHKFTNVFLSGTPAEVTTNWPVTASTQATPGLNSPIYDSVSGDIFVGDANGFLNEFSATTAGGVSTSGRLAYNTGGLVDPPLVDDTSGTDLIYQFVGYSDDTANNRPSYLNVFTLTGDNSVGGSNQFGTKVWFPNGSTTNRPAGTSTVMHAGTFDNTYFTGSGSTGNIYACSDGVLYQIPMATINAATPTVNSFSVPTSAAATCSPVTEFFNSSSSSDYLFMSVAADAMKSGTSTCTGACVFNYIAPAAAAITGSPIAGLSAAGGTSGIIIDNSGTGGGSEIYFTSIGGESCAGNGSTGNGTGSCAVQATQSGLQ